MAVPSTRLAPTSARQARRRQVVVGVVVLVVVAVGFVLLRPGPGPDIGTTTTGTTSTSADPSPSSSPTPSRAARTLPDYTSTGAYSRMPDKSPVRGSDGQVITYRVEVEQGSGVTSREFAEAVDATLRHPRGWTAGGKWRFRRVADEQPTLTIRLATPSTVDEGCAAGGADTDGYTSCRVGQQIYINLDRWYVGVPHIRDLSLYRRYLINHEVGHGLGRGHEECPAEGRRAPVMLQQTLALDGCTPNPWTVTGGGRQIRGPAAD